MCGILTCNVAGDLLAVHDEWGAAGGLIDEGRVTALVDATLKLVWRRGSSCSSQNAGKDGHVLKLHFE